MKRLAPRGTNQRRTTVDDAPLAVCIVDPRPTDYRDWRKAAAAHGLQVRIVASGEQALRLSRSTAVSLWVVNSRLPGISGCELSRMLRSQSPHTVVWLVADEYSAEVEREALASRATMFCCKATLNQAAEPTLRRFAAGRTVPDARGAKPGRERAAGDTKCLRFLTTFFAYTHAQPLLAGD